MPFKLKSTYSPAGDQPKAIEQIVSGFLSGKDKQTLLGVTGSGKTFTMAHVIQQLQRPTLIIAHNKTLAAQLCQEFRTFFPENAVEYFVSYYDYYQPEAYLPRTDTYIDKEAMINEEIDRLRHACTQALLTREDVIIVASVSCIYGLGSPKEYENIVLHVVAKDPVWTRDTVVHRLIDMQFERTTADVTRGSFRVRGETLEVMPMSEEVLYRLQWKDGMLDSIHKLHPVTRAYEASLEDVWVFPAKHYVASPELQAQALTAIERELAEQLAQFEREGKLLEAERLSRRTRYDVELIRNVGFCHGIENYSRHFDGRKEGQPPYTLLDFFPKDFLMIIDESHVTVPQIGGMYEGDRARKQTLIDHGFRLPSAKDNRPLRFPEFEARMPRTLFTSATPSVYESEHSDQVVEQIIRPTGLVDPEIFVRPVTGTETTKGQVEDVLDEIRVRVAKKERVLVTTLTKKMAEDLTTYLKERSIAVAYLHSDVDTLDRITVLSDLRRGKYDVLVGVNLLREGLDLPEVTLVAILDADKEGFLRSETSLIQTIGRAARNVSGCVIVYADQMTGSLKRALSETKRRRDLQLAFNAEHHITPRTVSREVKDIRAMLGGEEEGGVPVDQVLRIEMTAEPHEIEEVIAEKTLDMKEAARKLDFETATILRDEIALLKKELKEKGKKKRGSKKRG